MEIVSAALNMKNATRLQKCSGFVHGNCTKQDSNDASDNAVWVIEDDEKQWWNNKLKQKAKDQDCVNIIVHHHGATASECLHQVRQSDLRFLTGTQSR